MQISDKLLYTKDHEWVEEKAEGLFRVGITDFAQEELGDVVFIDIQKQGTTLAAGDSFGEVESTKSVSDLYSPVAGDIAAVNEKLGEEPGLVNSDPYGEGWMCEIAGTVDKSMLIDAGQYKEMLENFHGLEKQE